MALNDFLAYNCESGTTPQCPHTCSLPSCVIDDWDDSNVKYALDGTSNTPFVRLSFVEYIDPDNPSLGESETIIITTGNMSSYFFYNEQVDCSAVITHFQYAWGTIHSGNSCKIGIMDQEGSSFSEWMDKIAKNMETAAGARPGVYKMRVQWGWIVTGANGADCPSPVTGGFTPNPANTRIVCSSACYFIPLGLTMSSNNGKYFYELEGKDTFFLSEQNRMQNVYGTETQKISFKQAVINLSKDSTPRFNVEFKQRNADGTVGDMRFAPVLGGVPITISQTTPAVWCPYEGPAGIWRCNGLSPLAAISEWLKQVLAENPTNSSERGWGITVNFDPTYDCTNTAACFRIQTGIAGVDPTFPGYCIPNVITEPGTATSPTPGTPPRGRLILWRSPFPNCPTENDTSYNNVMATYLVNGGPCSPVIGFTPSVKWLLLPVAMRSGGATDPTHGTVRPAIRVLSPSPASQTGAVCGVGGRSYLSIQSTQSSNLVDRGTSVSGSIEAEGQHVRANMLGSAIEAELKVQGDPNKFLCSPILGTGKFVALVVMNPFFLTQDSAESTVSGCPGWSTLSVSNCNTTFTNRRWFIKGIEHNIKGGSYITTYKLSLFTPGGDGAAVQVNQPSSPNVPLHLGLDTSTSIDFWTNDGNPGYQGTVACLDRQPDGSIYAGTDNDTIGTFCEPAVIV